MSPVTVRFRASTLLPVDAGPLAPAALAGLGAGELERVRLRVGNREVPLAELAEVSAGDRGALRIEGAFPTLDRLGQGIAAGRIEIEGDVGAYLGQDMSGGRIELVGNAGAYAASGMSGGVLTVRGAAGSFLGGALAGARFGMSGGTVIVEGDAGDRAGDRMRRGLIAVRGRLGDFTASRMIGGTILGWRGCGADPGFAMRRGSLILGGSPPDLLPTFADNGTHTLPWLRLLARELRGLAAGLPPVGDRVRRWTGCTSVGGKGEILIAP